MSDGLLFSRSGGHNKIQEISTQAFAINAKPHAGKPPAWSPKEKEREREENKAQLRFKAWGKFIWSCAKCLPPISIRKLWVGNQKKPVKPRNFSGCTSLDASRVWPVLLTFLVLEDIDQNARPTLGHLQCISVRMLLAISGSQLDIKASLSVPEDKLHQLPILLELRVPRQMLPRMVLPPSRRRRRRQTGSSNSTSRQYFYKN